MLPELAAHLEYAPYKTACVIMKTETEGLKACRVCQWAYLKVECSMRAALAGWAQGKYGGSTNWSGGRISGGISTSSLHMETTDLAAKSA